MGFPPRLVALIQSLYNDQNAKIRWNGSHTDPFNLITEKLKPVALFFLLVNVLISIREIK